MQIAYSTGQVTAFKGASGLLQALIDWCTGDVNTPGRDWTVELNQEAKDPQGDTADSTCKEVILSNTGMSGNENIIIGIREYEYAASNEYNWELNGYLSLPPAWNAHANISHGMDGYDTTREHWNELPILQLFDSTIPYWFYSTQEFIIVSVRISTAWYQCYLGNMMRFASPNEYPHPLVIAGSNVGSVDYQAGGGGPVRPLDLGNYNVMCVTPANTWNINPVVEPMRNDSDTTSFVATPDNAALLIPAFYRENSICYGSLFNMFVFRRTNASSETLYTDPTTGRQYRTFAQGAGDFDYEFLAILEDPGTTTTTTTTTTSTTTT